ncbi:MAG: hypothetical protein Q4C53_07630 [Clostridia bacterium]|nr:hypothetical protein [Clostridia bacterium]
MTKEQSEDLTAQISMYISANAPVFECPECAEAYLETHAAGLPLALPSTDAIRDTVMLAFVRKTGLDRTADRAFLKKLFASAVRYSRDDFRNTAYLKNVHVPTVRKGRFTLTEAEYRPFELFQYDMPDLKADTVVPKIGFCTEAVRFPAIYEGDMPWMSACPSEINSMREDIAAAHGKVLTLGLGLGYYPYAVSELPGVESVTVVELSGEVIDLFREYLLPQYPNKEKIRIIHADAHEYMRTVRDGQYDFCFADIWESQIDGAEHCKRLFPVEKRLPHTEFRYWVRDAIDWFLEGE